MAGAKDSGRFLQYRSLRLAKTTVRAILYAIANILVKQ
jgi:hypothetical protein